MMYTYRYDPQAQTVVRYGEVGSDVREVLLHDGTWAAYPPFTEPHDVTAVVTQAYL